MIIVTDKNYNRVLFLQKSKVVYGTVLPSGDVEIFYDANGVGMHHVISKDDAEKLLGG